MQRLPLHVQTLRVTDVLFYLFIDRKMKNVVYLNSTVCYNMYVQIDKCLKRNRDESGFVFVLTATKGNLASSFFLYYINISSLINKTESI